MPQKVGVAGRQVLLEALTAWSPAGGSDDSEDAIKLTVKNTFIDVESPDSAHAIDLHRRGAQTCKARIADTAPRLFRTEDEEEDGGYVETPQAYPVAPVRIGPVTNSFTIPGQPDPTGSGLLTSPAPSPCNQAPTPQNLPAPPAYAAPQVFQDDMAAASPPPAAPPGARAGRQVLLEALTGGFDSPDKSSRNEDVKLIVKNTFIDIEDENKEHYDRQAMTCTARFSGPTPQLFPPTPGGARGPSTPGAVKSTKSPGAGKSPGSGPSLGSNVHGTVLPDGQPACQPCAWFYKESGCLNSAACRYCHLCPQGELKSRKKLKIARLRASDAAAVAAAAGDSPTNAGGTPTVVGAVRPISPTVPLLGQMIPMTTVAVATAMPLSPGGMQVLTPLSTSPTLASPAGRTGMVLTVLPTSPSGAIRH